MVLRSISTRACAALGTLIALLMTASPASAAATPELDRAWGQDGKLFGRGNTALVQHDGRLITWKVLGGGRALQLARFTPAGDLDASFGAGGYAQVVPPQRDPEHPRDFVLGDMVDLPDGRFLVVITWSYFDFAILRLHADGTLDASFADAGALLEPLDASGGTRLAVGPGGRFAVAIDETYDVHQVLRYRPDGTREPVNFEVSLPYIANCPPFYPCDFDSARSVDAYYRPDGKLGILMSTGPVSAGSAIVQLTADGVMDPNWSGDGVMHLSLARARGLVLMPGGDLLVSGEGEGLAHNAAPRPPVRVARVTGTGRLRASFGSNGIASAWNGALSTQSYTTWSTAGDLAVDGQGRIVVAGTGLRHPDRKETYCSVTRFTAGGQLDRTYSLDQDGTATDGRSNSLLCQGIAVVPGDRYLVSGRAGTYVFGGLTSLQQMFTG